jgi:hypothetical protein
MYTVPCSVYVYCMSWETGMYKSKYMKMYLIYVIYSFSRKGTWPSKIAL